MTKWLFHQEDLITVNMNLCNNTASKYVYRNIIELKGGNKLIEDSWKLPHLISN